MYVIGSNNTNNFKYKVDFEYELQTWLKDTKLYYTDSLYQEYGEAFVIGLTNTCYSMNKSNKEYGYGIFKGNVFEKTEETKYNVQVNLNYKGQIVDTLNTVNGSFEFSNLNSELKYDLEFIDTTNKYNPKMLKDITPELDIDQDPKIIIFFQPVVGQTMDYYFGIYAQGEATVNLQNAPTSYILEKVSNEIYRVRGANNNADINFAIRLDDYRNNGVKTVIQELKAKK